jgi:beta-glucosidase/6-phospho-beta-glucosidase/beta-galactosidase
VNWKSVLKRLRSSSALPPLPESFIFGVATSDHQCEAYKAEREDIRDVWERERGLTRRGKATNFEEHFEEDIRLAQKLGCTAFRFSVAWSRAVPRPLSQPSRFTGHTPFRRWLNNQQQTQKSTSSRKPETPASTSLFHSLLWSKPCS